MGSVLVMVHSQSLVITDLLSQRDETGGTRTYVRGQTVQEQWRRQTCCCNLLKSPLCLWQSVWSHTVRIRVDSIQQPPLENVCCHPEAIKHMRLTFPWHLEHYRLFNTFVTAQENWVHTLLVSWLLSPGLGLQPSQPPYRSTLVCNDDGGVNLEEWISVSDLDSSTLIFMCCCSLAWFGSNKDFLKSLVGTDLVKLKIKRLVMALI